MLRTLTALGAVATLLGATTIPDIASAHQRNYKHSHKSCRSAANTGTLVGAIGGGLVGNAVSSKGVGGTLVGAGVGGVAGHQIAKSNCKRKR